MMMMMMMMIIQSLSQNFCLTQDYGCCAWGLQQTLHQRRTARAAIENTLNATLLLIIFRLNAIIVATLAGAVCLCGRSGRDVDD